MTLILGARCIDGVVLVADRKFTSEEAKIDYGNKITGEIPGLLTAFSGDRATFEAFTNRLRSFLTTKIISQVKESLEKNIPIVDLGVRFDDLIWEINILQRDLRKHGLYNFSILAGISGIHYSDKKSKMILFYQDGGFIPVREYKALGTGEPYASYHLMRYYESEMKMEKFAELADFIIRFVEGKVYQLDKNVGLDPTYPFPQIIYIPDNLGYCSKYNNGEPKSDCSPNQQELQDFKTNSEKKLEHLYAQHF